MKKRSKPQRTKRAVKKPPRSKQSGSRIWQRAADDWYIEEEWCSKRFFEEEKFSGGIIDPACGSGRIVRAARAAGYPSVGVDIKRRVRSMPIQTFDFLSPSFPTEVLIEFPNICTNPPFSLFEKFALKALENTDGKIAMIWLVRRLAAARWLEETPLETIYLMTPRPSMPPGDVVLSNGKVGGGSQDFAWLIWNKQHTGKPSVKWLRRDARNNQEDEAQPR